MQTTLWRVTLEFTEDILGTVPKNEALYREFIESKKPEEQQDPEYTTVEAAEERGWTGFHKDDVGLFLYGYMIKGFLKNAANITKEQAGIKAYKSKVNNCVAVKTRRIYMADSDGNLITKAPDVLERSLRANTPQGPIVTLVRSDTLPVGTRITFRLKILVDKTVTPEHVKELFEYGDMQGIGQWRNAGYGAFDLVGWEEIVEGEVGA